MIKRTNIFDDIYKKFNYNVTNNFPYIIDMELTNHCNLNCKMCNRNLMERECGFMDYNVFAKVVLECFKYNSAIRFIRWGEPFLHSNILQYIKEVKDYNIPLHITTNGLLLNKDITKSIIDMELDSIIFSMQGLSSEEYENIRVGASWNTLNDNIQEFVEIRGGRKKPFIHITTTIDKDDDYKDRFIDYWKNYVLVDKVSVGITNYARIKQLKPKNRKYKVCYETTNKLGVDWDGSVTGCCGDYDRLMYVGNINDESIYNIWNNSKLLKSYRNLVGNKQHRCLTLCKDCYRAYEDI